MRRCALFSVAFSILWTGVVPAQPKDDRLLSRRERREPAIVLSTGGRTGTADVALFSSDGRELFVAGDDKVVTAFKVNNEGIDPKQVRQLRWPMWRERRGAIYAMDVARESKLVAVGGFGMVVSSVGVIDRETGKLEFLTNLNHESRENYRSIMCLAFSPSGRQLAIGTGTGHVFVWKLGAERPQFVGRDLPPGEQRFNRVRAMRFHSEDQVVSFAETGVVRRWSRSEGAWSEEKVIELRQPAALNYRAARFSPDGTAIAAVTHGNLLDVATFDGKPLRSARLKDDEYFRALAFEPNGQRLAVSAAQFEQADGFICDRDDRILILDLQGPELQQIAKLPHIGRGEALDWHGDRLAIAGGDNHEITSWNMKRTAKPESVVRGAGSGIWNVALSQDENYVAFQTQRDAKSTHPNQRGNGDVQVYNVKERKLEDAKPAGSKWLGPIKEDGGWTVYPDEKRPQNVWRVRHKVHGDFELPLDIDVVGRPSCFTFVKNAENQNTRLAVGHYWGFSLFELSAGPPKRLRLYSGHQGEVTSICPAASGEWVVTGSTDQTIQAWSLVEWPTQSALGASFRATSEAVRVTAVDVGSPAWEMGLIAGDEILQLSANLKKVFVSPAITKFADQKRLTEIIGSLQPVGSADDARRALESPMIGDELFACIRRNEHQESVIAISTTRTRPLWSLLVTRDANWLIWMWQAAYYETSMNGDSLAGWVMNDKDMDKEPRYYPLESFRKQFEREKVMKTLIDTRRVDDALAVAQGRGKAKNLFPIPIGENEPPAVDIQIPTKLIDAPVMARLVVAPRGDGPDYQAHRVELWINDFRVGEWFPQGKPFNETVTIDPEKMLRAGANRMILQVFNAMGRSEKEIEVTTSRPAAPGKLLGLGVGINNYKNSNVPKKDGARGSLVDLEGAVKDVNMQMEVWSKQQGKLFTEAQIRPALNSDASRKKIIEELERLQTTARPDDQLVLFLSGHGHFEVTKSPDADKAETSFYFCCPEYDTRRPRETGIHHEELQRLLAKIPCRKIVFLDACHSGGAAMNTARALTPGNQGPTIFVACDASEEAYEDAKLGNGVFTLAILHSLGEGFAGADRNGDGALSAKELFESIRRHMPELLEKSGLGRKRQHPQCFPKNPGEFPIFRQ